MTEKQFLLLLRSFVQAVPPEPDEDWNAPALCRMAAKQNLLPVLAYENKQWKRYARSDDCQSMD